MHIKDYGQDRQLTLTEHGKVELQSLTADLDACPAEILAWLKSCWREENFLKDASENDGIDKICDYLAGITQNTKLIDNPARKQDTAAVREAEKAVAAAERGLAVLLEDPAIPPAAKNTRLIPAAQEKITAASRKLDAATAARAAIPAKPPANVSDPEAQVAVLRAGRCGLQMVLRLLAHNAEHWLASHLNAYLRDDDEYRAITRQTIMRGLAGTISSTSAGSTVTRETPSPRRCARALALLLAEINRTPPAIPGDPRPITYQLTASPADRAPPAAGLEIWAPDVRLFTNPLIRRLRVDPEAAAAMRSALPPGHVREQSPVSRKQPTQSPKPTPILFASAGLICLRTFSSIPGISCHRKPLT